MNCKGKENSAQAIRERAIAHFRSHRNAQINVNMPSSVSGLGQTDGMEFWIRDINGEGRAYLEAQFKTLQEASKQYSSFSNLDKRSKPR